MERLKKIHSFNMMVAQVASQLSYCQKRKVGAIIADGRNIIAYGFNGAVNGQENICEDEDGKTLPGIVHAEVNAIVKAGTEAAGKDMYVTLYPCIECVKLMAQAGIKTVYYLQDHKNRTDNLGLPIIKLESTK